MTAMAAVDRLVHHSVILEFGGESKRFRMCITPLKPRAHQYRADHSALDPFGVTEAWRAR